MWTGVVLTRGALFPRIRHLELENHPPFSPNMLLYYVTIICSTSCQRYPTPFDIVCAMSCFVFTDKVGPFLELVLDLALRIILFFTAVCRIVRYIFTILCSACCCICFANFCVLPSPRLASPAHPVGSCTLCRSTITLVEGPLYPQLLG